jgi:hypothetical protein
MELTVADQRILIFSEQLSFEDAEKKAWNKKVDAFGTITKLVGFLNKPQDGDFKLIYKEHRYEPFWHVIANAHYVYDRNTMYQVPVSGPEVKSVTYLEKNFEVTNAHIHQTVIEHCVQNESEEVLVDGITGKPDKNLRQYLALSPVLVQNSLEEEVKKDTILVPPQVRISALMRDTLAKMIKGIQADKIIEETIKVENVDLYYHPVYAFNYLWKSKAKEAIVQVDSVTGEVSVGTRVFKEYLGKILDKNFLFDLGADAAGILIPGGSIAVKIAKKYVDNRDRN